MRTRVLFRLLVSILALLVTSIPATAPAQLPAGFSLQQVGWGPFGTGRPVGFALLPDHRVLMVERNTGNVRLNAVDQTSSVVIHTIADVNFVGGEQGLLGVCVDPAWPARPYLYFHYNHTSGNVYLTMFEVQGDLTDSLSTSLTLTNPYHLLTDLRDANELHQAGTVRFGPDGTLFMSLGDDGWACSAQDTSVLAGEILRLDVSATPGVGTGPPAKSTLVPSGNPFAGPSDNERLVWAWGLRNPFRFTVDRLNGDLFIGDVGLITYEEVDHIPFAGGAGQNFGWPLREGPINPELGHTCGLGNTFTDPIYSFPRTEGVTVIAGPRYRTPTTRSAAFSYPPEYEGSLFVIEFYSGWWRRLVEGPGGWELAPAVAGQPSAEHWADPLPYCSDVQLGADGAIYYCRLIPPAALQGVFRIVPTLPTDQPDVIVARSLVVAPNPARSSESTRFVWSTRRSGPQRLRIHDTAGRLVRSLESHSAGGPTSVGWKGTDDAGNPVAAGTYLYELETSDGDRLKGKIIRLRR